MICLFTQNVALPVENVKWMERAWRWKGQQERSKVLRLVFDTGALRYGTRAKGS